jgi:hypothetical protein
MSGTKRLSEAKKDSSVLCSSLLLQCVRKVAVHLGYGTGSSLYRRSWTSLPTPFINAQRLSERTVYECTQNANLIYLVAVQRNGSCLTPYFGTDKILGPTIPYLYSRYQWTWYETYYDSPGYARVVNAVDVGNSESVPVRGSKWHLISWTVATVNKFLGRRGWSICQNVNMTTELI